MIQLVQPNFSVSGSVGLCLDYARRVFGAPAGTPTAWQAWLNTQFKHIDQDFPPDVAILQWYSFISGGANLGHVTINDPGVGVYSSPYRQATPYALLPSVSEVERIYGVQYVGWSEDINGVRVAQEENDMPNDGDVDNAYLQANGRLATDAEKAVYTSKSWSAPDGLYYGKVAVDWANAQKAAANPAGFTLLDTPVYTKNV